MAQLKITRLKQVTAPNLAISPKIIKKDERARRLLGYAIDIFMHKCYN